MKREYETVVELVRAGCAGVVDSEERMSVVVDALWDAFEGTGVSWVGFYFADETKPESERLILGPRRDKPACSPIGLHGVGGAAYLSREIQIVQDVAELGENYVACDPRDLSEIVVPMVDDAGTVWAVLDLDSFEIGAFDETDDAGLRSVLEAAGFTVPPARASA